jgi:hypothetical protein
MPPTLAPGPTRKRQPRRPAEHGHPGGAIAITAQTRRYEWTGPLCMAQRFADGGELELNEVSSACWWQIYKFRSGLVPPERYPYGPYGRTHGLRYGEFFDSRERSFMLRPVMHVWSKTVTTLTAEPSWYCSSRLSTSGPRTPAPASGERRDPPEAATLGSFRMPLADGHSQAVAVWRAGICGSDRTEFAVRGGVAHMVIVRHQGVVILGDRDLRPAARWAAVRDQLVESLPALRAGPWPKYLLAGVSKASSGPWTAKPRTRGSGASRLMYAGACRRESCRWFPVPDTEKDV